MDNKKKGIIAVSTGTSYHEAIKLNIEACETAIREAFPAYELRRAFSSRFTRNKLKERDNIHIDSVEEALEKMLEEGFTDIILQSLHIIPGGEFHEKIVKNLSRFRDKFEKITFGRPLLFYMDDYRAVLKALKSRAPGLKNGEAVLLMGHGTEHPANAAYSCMQSMIEDEKLPFYIATMEHYPLLSNIIPRLRENNIKKIVLMPFMLVAGAHALEDMSGEGSNSWRSILEGEGFNVSVYLQGLGENPEIRDIFVQHTADAINDSGI